MAAPPTKRMRVEGQDRLSTDMGRLLDAADGAQGVLAAAGLRRGNDEHGGAGLFATRALPQGFELKVPRQLVLDSHAATSTELGLALAEAGFSSEERMLIVLADARASGSRRPYAGWAATLSEAAPDVASWPPAAQALLAGTDLGAALPLVEEQLGDLHHRLSALAATLGDLCSVLSEGDLRWARGMALSRRFPARLGMPRPVASAAAAAANTEPEAGTWGMVGGLIPLMDLLNHDPAADPELISLEATDDAFPMVCLKNRKPLKEGEQAFTNYGHDKSNEELLAGYGFALANNPADRVNIALEVPSENGGENGVRVFSIERGGEVPLKVWRALGILY